MICAFDFAFCSANCSRWVCFKQVSNYVEDRLELMLNYCHFSVSDKLLPDMNVGNRESKQMHC